jgi:hypothetical protein
VDVLVVGLGAVSTVKVELETGERMTVKTSDIRFVTAPLGDAWGAEVLL